MIQDVFERLKNIVAKNTENTVDVKKITLETNLKDMGINSISFIKIIVDIELEYGFEFNDDELNYESEKFVTFGSFVNYILEKTS